jgi:uncharacterized RDD family membrane protein YckC
MTDPLPCPSCSFANALGANVCVKCGTELAETPDRPQPGETLRDPDDLTLPPSPLLRAVLRGDPDAFTRERPARPPAAPATAAPLDEHPESPIATPAPVVAPEPVIVPPPAVTPAPPVNVTPAPPAIIRPTVESLSPSVDQTALLRDLAERLHTRPADGGERPDAARREAVVRYAGFLRRVTAFLIDGVVLFAFGVPLAAAGYYGIRAGMLFLGRPTPVEVDEALLTLLIVAWFIMATVYFTLLHRAFGQTIGKSFLGIAVRTIGLDDVGLLRALIRTLGYAVSSTFLGFGFVLAAITPRRRAWHDFLAGTCVVQLPAEDAA